MTWSDEEKQYLISHYTTTDLKDITSHLHRTESAVYHMASILKLRKTRITCPICRSKDVATAGIDSRVSKQRYLCKCCAHAFLYPAHIQDYTKKLLLKGCTFDYIIKDVKQKFNIEPSVNILYKWRPKKKKSSQPVKYESEQPTTIKVEPGYQHKVNNKLTHERADVNPKVSCKMCNTSLSFRMCYNKRCPLYGKVQIQE